MAKNPIGLTVRQHIFPARSIRRFCNEDGVVETARAPQFSIFEAPPTNATFCAKRAWEQRSEDQHKLTIEDPYQKLADEILAGKYLTLNRDANRRVSRMFALWRTRAYLNSNPLVDAPLVGIHGPIDGFDPLERDQLEKAGFVVSGVRNEIPGRMFAWPFMSRHIALVEQELKDVQWGIVTSLEGEFLVPDGLTETALLPVSPTIVLSAGNGDIFVKSDEVQKINIAMLSEMKSWYFSRQIAACPV